MEDQLISFDTAVLAKETGFSEPCFYYYSKGVLKAPFLENGSSTDNGFRVDLTDLLENNNYKHLLNCCSAPTQSLLQRWLREKHGILIEPTYNTSKSAFDLVICQIGGFTIHNKDWSSTNYEQVLETGLQEALKSIPHESK